MDYLNKQIWMRGRQKIKEKYNARREWDNKHRHQQEEKRIQVHNLS